MDFSQIDSKFSEIIGLMEKYKSHHNIMDLTLKKVKIIKLENMLEKLDKYREIFNKYKEAYVSSIESSDIKRKSAEIVEYIKKHGLEPKPAVDVKDEKIPDVKIMDIGMFKKIKFYNNKNHIPLLEYGAVNNKINDKIIILFRLNNLHFVTCDKFSITNNVATAKHLLVCTRGAECDFGENCNFYHDPQESKSNHVQVFSNIYLNKSCWDFGDHTKIGEQIKNLNIKKINNLMRYCANVLLVGSLITK
jgi:hypothetical protein